jgi:non-ribosomal peptide synthase protein (TIGR01720 family)
VIEEQLQWTILYGEESYDRVTIESLAEEFLGSLRTLGERCRHGEATAVTPADFEYVSLSQEELDSLVDSFDRAPGEAR